MSEHPSKRTYSASFVTVQPGKSHILSGSGIISEQYPRGSTLVLTGSGPKILGKTTLRFFPLPLNSPFPGFWAIFMNIEEINAAHFIFRYFSWLALKVKLEGGEK